MSIALSLVRSQRVVYPVVPGMVIPNMRRSNTTGLITKSLGCGGEARVTCQGISAFQAAYVSWFFLFPLAVAMLAAEAVILWAFNRKSSVKVIVACALGINLASYVIGLWLSPKLYIGSGLVVEVPLASTAYPLQATNVVAER
jgi:hypothetical protein